MLGQPGGPSLCSLDRQPPSDPRPGTQSPEAAESLSAGGSPSCFHGPAWRPSGGGLTSESESDELELEELEESLELSEAMPVDS